MVRRRGDDDEYAEAASRWTYAFASDSAPMISERIAEERGRDIADVVHAAIEHSFRASASPKNVLCKGMCRRTERERDGTPLRSSTAVSVRCVSSAYEAFKSPFWKTFCERVGSGMMMYILLYCSVFVRVGSDADAPLLQICGYPMTDTRRKQAVAKAMATSKDRARKRRRQRSERKSDGNEARGVESSDKVMESKCEQEPTLTANPFISSIDVREVIRLSDLYGRACAQNEDASSPSSSEDIMQTQEEPDEEHVSTKKSFRKPSWFRRRAAKQRRKTEEPSSVDVGADPDSCEKRNLDVRHRRSVRRTWNASRDNVVKLADQVFDRGVFMFRSSFTKKPGFPSSHPLRCNGTGVRGSRRLYHAIFKPKKLVKASKRHKTVQALNRAKSTYRIPRKYRTKLLPALREMLERTKRCPFARLLNKYAPMPRGLVVSAKKIETVSEESLLSSYTPPRGVAVFVWKVLETIVPAELLGSQDTQNKLRESVQRIVSMRRYERLTLHELMQGIRTSDFKCFKAETTNAGNAGQAEASQRKMVTKWMSWLVNDIVFPIIRAHFYVTDTQVTKNRIFFYRKGVWVRLVTATLQKLEQTSYKRLSAKQFTNMLERANTANLGFSNMRFLPKTSGLRPLSTLNKPTTVMLKSNKARVQRLKRFEAINTRLKDVQDVLHHETINNPDIMGAAVGDYRGALLRLGPCLRTIRRQRLVGRCKHAYIIATDIKGAFDNLPLETLERVAVDLISSSSYQTLHYAVVKPNGEAKYKKSISSLPRDKPDKVPGPLVPCADDATNTSSIAALKGESKHSIVVDAGFAKRISEDNILPLLRSHLRENVVSARGQYLLQTVGIPQGSIVSPLLCSLFYGHLEKEYKLISRFCTERSTVCRWMDDMLVISMDEKQATDFIDVCKQGFEKHGCTLNAEKTMSNFTHGAVVEKRTYQSEEGRDYIPWCGLLIDCLTLEVMVDYSRYSGEFVRESMNLPLARKAWTRLPERICGFLKPKCAAIFYDESINGKLTVRVNVFQLFLMAAMKTHSYIVAAAAVPGCDQIAPVALFRAIREAIRFGQILIQRQSSMTRGFTDCRGAGGISNQHIEFLAMKAFLKILQQKQTRYKRIIQLLNSRLTSNVMKRASRNTLLARAMDPSRNTIFSTIRF